ncbi:hypothetical protein TrVE_jg5875 [Triparma verrucosa]|uniref:FAD/NAD(P)-binding domain-containing protein n=1 Tax=Triparma verrucosa TaxID=1606542 RepID=A0A9W7FF39_9STRA|nr:hypothetical protein TrVE_jg5875 [Triparma verrucosa]
MSALTNHPVQAYIDDASALIDCIVEDDSLLSKLKTFRISGSRSSDQTLVPTLDPTLKKLNDLVNGFRDLSALLEEGNFGGPSAMEEEKIEEEKSSHRSSHRSSHSPLQQNHAMEDDSDDSSNASSNASSNDSNEETFSVVIIGASASGLGVASALLSASPDLDIKILERSSCVGSSFLSWPPFTRFISPSFYSNPFGPNDLNQITPDENGPQTHSQSQHPTGAEYASYLQTLSRTKKFNNRTLESYISFNTHVSSVTSLPYAGSSAFKISMDSGASICSRYVIYAGGEYVHPFSPLPLKAKSPNASVHYSEISDWKVYSDCVKKFCGTVVIVGGGEAGFDAALHVLDEAGDPNDGDEAGLKPRVILIDRGSGSGEGADSGGAGKVDDPSTTLTPITRARVEEARKKYRNLFQIEEGCECTEIGEEVSETGRKVFLAKYRSSRTNRVTTVSSEAPVILATGFNLSQSKTCCLNGICDWDESGRPVLTQDCDEVERTKGVFVVGPMVKHNEEVIFCFIYKFRCRFALVAGEILSRLIAEYHSVQTNSDGTVVVDEEGHKKLDMVERTCRFYQEKGMLITDLSCAVCGDVEGSC